MKKIYYSICLLFVSALSLAQVVLTQTTNNDVVVGSSVTCNGGGVPTDQSFYRAFNLTTLGYTQFRVTKVHFGVESFAAGTSAYSVQVKVYSLAGGAFPAGTLTEVASQDVEITAGDAATVKEVTLTVPAIVNTTEMVIALRLLPGADAGGAKFMPGSNANGQTAPCYITAASCGVATPTNLAGIGFPNMHLVLHVTGDDGLASGDFNLLKSDYSLYPNPVNSELNVALINGNVVKSATVSTLTGQKLNVEVKNNTINTSSLNSGVYMISIETENGTIVEKIVKQ